jgi:hypothetical protein
MEFPVLTNPGFVFAFTFEPKAAHSVYKLLHLRAHVAIAGRRRRVTGGLDSTFAGILGVRSRRFDAPTPYNLAGLGGA